MLFTDGTYKNQERCSHLKQFRSSYIFAASQISIMKSITVAARNERNFIMLPLLHSRSRTDIANHTNETSTSEVYLQWSGGT